VGPRDLLRCGLDALRAIAQSREREGRADLRYAVQLAPVRGCARLSKGVGAQDAVLPSSGGRSAGDGRALHHLVAAVAPCARE
jgi:hypothetical protein